MTATSTPFHTKPPATQAGMLCNHRKFQAWLKRQFPIEWFLCMTDDASDDVTAAAVVRHQCGVDSRRQLDCEPGLSAWRSLLNEWVKYDTGFDFGRP